MMKTVVNNLPYIPERPAKPRIKGLTMVMDKGLSLREAEDFVSVCGDYTDYVKRPVCVPTLVEHFLKYFL